MQVIFDFDFKCYPYKDGESSHLKMTINNFSGNKDEYNTCFKAIGEFVEQLPQLIKQPITLVNK